MNIRHLRDAYINHCNKYLSFSTIQTYKSCFKYLDVIDNISVQDIKHNDLIAIINNICRSPKTINNIISSLQSLLRYAVDIELIDQSPAAKLRRCKVPEKIIKVITKEQSTKLINMLRKHDDMVGLFYAIAFTTGMRTGELYALQWDDILWQEQKIAIHSAIVCNQLKSTKTNKVRYINVSANGFSYLEELQAITGNMSKHLFIHNGSTFMQNNDKKRRLLWVQCCKLCNIKKIKPSATRHTYASLYLSAGAKPLWVAQQLGHSSVTTTYKFYGRWINSQENQEQANLVLL